jgi:hypothetical protein
MEARGDGIRPLSSRLREANELCLTELTHTIERFDGNHHLRFAAIIGV